ncbi:polymer-forming cytoskeletal protein [Bermanella marisrubri]|uniref:Integral membrane protein CcmA involved in cell shape determination n=1 Tax=Bermanella marisrubri TaxID=207949 RepID=Q1MXQ6_9GAMM|nr:polymer-forming cytoskeletal protein [Bermanella marisrubri]EAT10761.1 Integral membrane protein CcmA involved in cell shape determination [Oceanobacter sp. RED65] [Bermanella marisrubri]QIZ83088.1 polymer-forming cytoskeletal protein [Bermanella marisrubri]
MLSSKNKNPGHFDTLISNNAEIKGDLHFSGGLHIDGKVSGNIFADADSNAVVRISETGIVEGEIKAPNIIINGRIVGNVYSASHLELAKKAMVSGDVHYVMMEMVMGAQVNGSLIHQADPKKGKGRKGKEPALEEVTAEKE